MCNQHDSIVKYFKSGLYWIARRHNSSGTEGILPTIIDQLMTPRDNDL